MIKKILATVVSVGLFFAASPVMALAVYTSSDASGQDTVRASADSGGNSSTGSAVVSGDESVSATLDTRLGTGVKNIVKSIIAHPSASSSANGSGNMQVSVNVSSGPESDTETIIMTRADVDAGTAEPSSINAADVNTKADLSGYVAGQLKADKNLAEIDARAHSVAVTYAQPAKLFGLIPVTIEATVAVDESGNVSVNYPWYTFLMTTNGDKLKMRVEERVPVQINAQGVARNATAEASTKFAAKTQAQLVHEITAAMQEELLSASAQMSANASANVSTP